MIYFVADTHFNHKNICKATSEWDDVSKCRDFLSLEDMNEAILNGVNNYVKQDDELWILGDFAFQGVNSIYKFRQRINCWRVHLIFGNHDQHIENNKPIIEEGGKIIHTQNLFSSVGYVFNGKLGGVNVFLSHYAHRVWDKSHKGVIHLYGHSHATLEDQPWGKSMDVGIDNAYRLFGEYRPFSLDEIVKLMGKREIKILDHHNFRTT